MLCFDHQEAVIVSNGNVEGTTAGAEEAGGGGRRRRILCGFAIICLVDIAISILGVTLPKDSSSQKGTSGSGNSSSGKKKIRGCKDPVDLGVRLIGRYYEDKCNQRILMGWSGTGFIAQIQGNSTGLQFVQDGPTVEYTVVIDGIVQPKIRTDNDGNHRTYYVVVPATGSLSLDETQQHIIEIYRRSEVTFGTVAISNIKALEGKLVVPPPPPKSSQRSIEIFGDSITAGHGNEGTEEGCPFSIDTENHYMTYTAILSRNLNADLSTLAWSGIGVVSNWGGKDDGTPTLPDMIELATVGDVVVDDDVEFKPDFDSALTWNTTLVPEPDLTMINLGTNDYWGYDPPTLEEFTAGYLDLLKNIRKMYPTTKILTLHGPMAGDESRKGILAAIEQFGDYDYSNNNIMHHTFTTENMKPTGCAGHPSIATHQAMAKELEPVVTAFLGW